MNEAYFLLSAGIVYLAVCCAAKWLGQAGLTAWVAASVILANIATTKQVQLLGLDVTLGNVLFSSVFLATDILTEAYGSKAAKKAVFVGLMSAISFPLFGLIVNAFAPNGHDMASGALSDLLTFSARISVASAVCFLASNLADVWLFEKFRERSKRNLWLRNNVCTITCNCAENFLLIFGAFYGVYDAQTCCSIAASTCVIEAIAGLLDTPFVYLGRHWAARE